MAKRTTTTTQSGENYDTSKDYYEVKVDNSGGDGTARQYYDSGKKYYTQPETYSVTNPDGTTTTYYGSKQRVSEEEYKNITGDFRNVQNNMSKVTSSSSPTIQNQESNNQVSSEDPTKFNANPEITGFEGFIANKVNPALYSILQFLGAEFETDSSGVPKVTSEGLKKLATSAVLTGATAGVAAGISGGAFAGISVNSIKTGLTAKIATVSTSTALTSNSLIKLAVGGAVVGLINGRLSDLETSIVNERESLSMITSAVSSGIYTASEGLSLLDDIESDINKTEKALNTTKIFSIRAWLGKGKELETRIQKARTDLDIQRRTILNYFATESATAITDAQQLQTYLQSAGVY